MTDERRYLAFLIRLWSVHANGELLWRTSAEDVHTGERHAFAELAGLCDFLRAAVEEDAPAAPAAAESLPAAPDTELHGLRFDAPDYAIDGPYAVGVRYVNIPAATENDRDLIATVWYPAQKPGNATGEMVYDLQFAPGEIPGFTVLGHAQLGAPPDASGAPYPLVVYSHATWSFGQETPYFTEHLVSRGFVVISADHEDNWSTAFAPAVKEAMIHRPQEATREIDFAESLAAPSGELPGMIDTMGVGVAGWSMGGETALALAGARWDTNGLRAWCVDDAAADVDACLAEFAVLAGLEETPQGLWPARLDERVRAVIPLAGYTLTFGKDGIESVDVPVLFMVGSGAVAAERTLAVDAPYKSTGAERKAQVVFDYGEALLIFSSCADSPSIAALGFPMFCTDPVWDMERAHDLINHFATAFLLAELKGDADAALAPENVSFPGVQYEAAGYTDAIVATSFESKDVVSIDPANPEQPTVLAADLAYPLGLATEAGNLYVGDFLAGQILQVIAGGVTLEPPTPLAEGLQGPEGMALTGDGRLLVVESGANRLSIVDITSGQISTLIPELGLLRDLPRSRPLHYFFNGVDISPSGMIYVTADESNVIYRLPLPPK